jgi:D-alanine-D-alanine ligase
MDLEDDLTARLKNEKIEVVYNILHGRFGEDGTVQGLLEIANIPYTGSKVLASALAMNKLAAKRVFDAVGIPTPRYAGVDSACDIKKEAKRLWQDFPSPFVLKPTSEGSSLGVVLIKKEHDFEAVLEKSVAEFRDVFVEEYVQGREVTVGVLGTGKGHRPEAKGRGLEALPVLELVSRNEFYDYDAKYTEGMTDFILPARLTKALTKKVQETALAAHRALGCYGVSRVDMIVKDDVPYVHEVNTIPGMTERSDLPAEAAHCGISFDRLVVRILESAY